MRGLFSSSHAKRAMLVTAIATMMLALPADVAANRVAETAIPRPYKNCTQLNKKYPHGLGRANARDKTSGDPVTTFRRSTRLYNIAMSHNRGLDRDKDGIACEKE